MTTHAITKMICFAQNIHAPRLVKLYSKNKQNFPHDFFYDPMMNEEAKNLARNLRRIMDYHEHNQRDVEKISGVAQKTVSNILNPGDEKSTRLDIIEAIAKGYGMKTWHLLIDDLPEELLINHSIEKVIDNFRHSSPKGRDAILKVSEATADYSLDAEKKLNQA